MKPLVFAAVVTISLLSMPTMMTSTASAYQCRSAHSEVKVHRPTRVASRIQARKSWSIKVEDQMGLAWSVWNIAKDKSINCEKAGQRWVCTARAKACLYVVQ